MSALTTQPRRRTAAKVIYFHPDELARITSSARASCQSPSQFIRESALGKSTAPDPIINELARIARRLDQLTQLHDKDDSVLAEEVRAALKRHWGIVRELLTNRRRDKGAAGR